jgi:hypothetical protein
LGFGVWLSNVSKVSSVGGAEDKEDPSAALCPELRFGASVSWLLGLARADATGAPTAGGRC